MNRSGNFDRQLNYFKVFKIIILEEEPPDIEQPVYTNYPVLIQDPGSDDWRLLQVNIVRVENKLNKELRFATSYANYLGGIGMGILSALTIVAGVAGVGALSAGAVYAGYVVVTGIFSGILGTIRTITRYLFPGNKTVYDMSPNEFHGFLSEKTQLFEADTKSGLGFWNMGSVGCTSKCVQLCGTRFKIGSI
jgi:hypothetical protein